MMRVWVFCHNGTKPRPIVFRCKVDNYWCAPLPLNANSAGSNHNNMPSAKTQVEGVNM